MRSILFSILLVGCLSLASSHRWKRSDMMADIRNGIDTMNKKVTEWGMEVHHKVSGLMEDMKKTDLKESANKAMAKIREIEANLKASVNELREKLNRNEDIQELKKKVDQAKREVGVWMANASVQVEIEMKNLKEAAVVYYGIFKDKLAALKVRMGAQWNEWMNKYMPNNGKDLMNDMKEGINAMNKKIIEWGKAVEMKTKELIEDMKKTDLKETADIAMNKIRAIEANLKAAVNDLREKLNKNEDLAELKTKVDNLKSEIGTWLANANVQVEMEMKSLKESAAEYYRIFKDKMVDLKKRLGVKWNAFWNEVSS